MSETASAAGDGALGALLKRKADLEAQIEALKGEIDAYRIELNELRDRLSSREAQVDLLRQQLADES